jgi:hypothetical protein
MYEGTGDTNEIVGWVVLIIFLLIGVSVLVFAAKISAWTDKMHPRLVRSLIEDFGVKLHPIFMRPNLRGAAATWYLRIIGFAFTAGTLYVIYTLLFD